MSCTNREFLQTKRSNFIKFCRETITKKKKHSQFTKFSEKLSNFETVSIDLFVAFIVENMVPHKNDPMAFVNNILRENGAEPTDLSPDELKKIALYVECFISVVSE